MAVNGKRRSPASVVDKYLLPGSTSGSTLLEAEAKSRKRSIYSAGSFISLQSLTALTPQLSSSNESFWGRVPQDRAGS